MTEETSETSVPIKEEDWRKEVRICRWCEEKFTPDIKDQDCCCDDCTKSLYIF